MTQESTSRGGNENLLVVLMCNIAIPVAVLSKLSRPERLGPVWALLLALVFPVGYFVYDLVRRRKANPIAILGFISILGTGSFGLMQVDAKWFAVKEALMPTLMGLAVIASLKTKTPLVRTLLYNDKVIDVEKVDVELRAKGNHERFEKLLVFTTYLLALSFLVAAVLNYIFATMIVKSQTGTPEFNEELGKMTAVSHPVVIVSCMVVTMFALWRLLAGIKAMTGLDLEAVFKNPPDKKAATKS